MPYMLSDYELVPILTTTVYELGQLFACLILTDCAQIYHMTVFCANTRRSIFRETVGYEPNRLIGTMLMFLSDRYQRLVES